MAIYKIENKALKLVESTSFESEGILERRDLQRMLRENIEIISPGTLIIAEEFSDWVDSKKRVDLLGIDEAANLVIIELKRNDSANMELQAIRYAAMLSTLTFDKAVQIYEDFLGTQQTKNAREELLKFLKWQEPKADFANDVRIVLAAADFSPELTTSVLWLNERGGLDIRCVLLKPSRNGEQILLDVQEIIPVPNAEDYQVKLRVQEEQRREARQRDYSKYSFGGEIYAKSRLVLAVVKAYLQKNPETTFDQLEKVFPDSLQGSWGVFASHEEGQEVFEESDYNRYFTDERYVLETGDKKRIVICTEWTLKNVTTFIEHANKLGFQISQVP